MESIKLEEKYILEYIRTTINELKITSRNNIDFKYHHTTAYKSAPLILRFGILSMLEQNNSKIKEYAPYILEKMKDTDSHINGIDSISLSIVGLTDLDPKKEVYNPFSPLEVDFLISNVRAIRKTTHYDNEFLSKEKIDVDKFRGVDIRLLKLIENSKNEDDKTIDKIIKKYNYLKDMAIAIKESKLDIPFREMSYDNLTMDVDKIACLPQLKLK